MFYKKVVPRNFAKFTGKVSLPESLLIKLQSSGLLRVLLSSIAHAVLY